MRLVGVLGLALVVPAPLLAVILQPEQLAGAGGQRVRPWLHQNCVVHMLGKHGGGSEGQDHHKGGESLQQAPCSRGGG